MALKSRDIHGNAPGSRVLGAFHTRPRTSFKVTGKNDDIVGSKPGTLVKGIKVPTAIKQRHINPLDPQYQYPGCNEQPVNLKDDKEGSSMAKS